MPTIEAEHAAELAREVCADLEAWAEQYPVVDRSRFPAVALTTAVHLPNLSRADRALVAQVTIWIFSFDEIVDEIRVSGSELAARVVDYKAITQRLSYRGGAYAPQSRDPLGEVLWDIGQRLAAYPSFEALAAHWRTSFERMVDGIVRERELGAMLATLPDTSGTTLRALPSYDALMETALYSIGVPHYLAACLIVHNDPQVVARLPTLVRIGEACARAFRLANDLRTWEKEEREQTFNTLMAVRREMQSAQPGLSAAEYQERALQYLQRRLIAHVAQTQVLLAASPVPDGAVEVGIARLVEFVTQFYAAHDYHTFQLQSPVL